MKNPTLANFMVKYLKISYIIIIFVSLLVKVYAESTVHMDAIILIDNSGSMDLPGHDPEGNRFEAAKIFIDKSEAGDQIALVDFSGSSQLILPLTEVTHGRKSIMKNVSSTIRSNRRLTDIDLALKTALKELTGSRSEPEHTPVVILLTDGEIDVTQGTVEQKRIAAKRSEEILFSQTIPEYVQNYIPIYTIALGTEADTSVLKNIAQQAKLKEQINERHHFVVNSGTELVETLSSILSQIKKQSRVVKKYHFDGKPIHQTTDTTFSTKKLKVDVLLDHKKDMQIALKGPDGKTIKPYSQGDKYNLYQVENPAPGEWDLSIEGKGENEVIVATDVEGDIRIDLPFASRFKLGEDIPIFANIVYKNRVIEDNEFEVEISGKKELFKIKELLLSIEKPDRTKSGPFKLKKDGGSYTYFYKDADSIGNYTLDFELKFNLMNREDSILAQKRIYVFQATEPPTVLFKKLKEKYFSGDSVIIEILVTKNAELMQSSFITVEVNSPKGSQIISVPRKGLKLYSIEYTQTEQEGKYTFTIPTPKIEEYELLNSQQSIVIMTPSALPWKLILALGIIITVIIVLFILWKIKGWNLKPQTSTNEPEITEQESIQGVRADNEQPTNEKTIPEQIWFWENYALIGYIHLSKRKNAENKLSYYNESFGKIQLELNGDKINEVDFIVNNGDKIKINNLEFTMIFSDDGSGKVVIPDSMVKDIETSNKNGLLKWTIISESEQPKKGDIIYPVFVRGNIVNIGRNTEIESNNINDIILLHESVDIIHASIKKSGISYFLKPIGKVVLNDEVLEHGKEKKIYSDDIIKIGVFSILVLLDKSELQLKIIGCD